jgi:pimeloyl-ACP methyl ester carboxylesterase
VTRTSVAVLPGVGVRAYLVPTMAALAARGLDVDLLPAPGQPGMASDLRRYAEQVGPVLRRMRPDLLVGLSVGCQTAGLVTVDDRPSPRVVLVAPTVDPAFRTLPRLLARWARAGNRESSGLLRPQASDWADAGIGGLAAVLRSAVRVPLEQCDVGGSAHVTVVHGEQDVVTSHAYAASLAARWGGRLVSVPQASHSWPYDDPDRFGDVLLEAADE